MWKVEQTCYSSNTAEIMNTTHYRLGQNNSKSNIAVIIHRDGYDISVLVIEQAYYSLDTGIQDGNTEYLRVSVDTVYRLSQLKND